MQTIKDEGIMGDPEMNLQEEVKEVKPKKEKKISEDVIIDNEVKEEKTEPELDRVLKMKPADQIKYLLSEIEVLKNNQSVLENRIARYKKLKKV